MSKAVSSDFTTRLLIFFAILFPVGVYLFRCISDETIGGAGMGLFFLLMATFPLICILILLVLGLVLWILYYAFAKSTIPLLFLIGTFFIAVILPVPAGPAEKTFYAHRSVLKLLLH